MSRRRPTKAEYNRIVTIDLLADWRPYADPLPEPRDDSDWVYFGTITRDGVTGALAWRAGWYGVGIGATVTECSQWDHIKINRILMDDPPNLDFAPVFHPLRETWPAIPRGRVE